MSKPFLVSVGGRTFVQTGAYVLDLRTYLDQRIPESEKVRLRAHVSEVLVGSSFRKLLLGRLVPVEDLLKPIRQILHSYSLRWLRTTIERLSSPVKG